MAAGSPEAGAEAPESTEDVKSGDAATGTTENTDTGALPYTEPHPAPIFDTGPHPQSLLGDDAIPGSGASAAVEPASVPVASAWAFSDEPLQWRAPEPLPEASEVADDPAPASGRHANPDSGPLAAESLSTDPDEGALTARPAREDTGALAARPRAAAVPVVVPGSYQSLRYWQLALTLAGVWLLAAGIGVGLAYWWVHDQDKTWPVFTVLGYTVAAVVAALVVSMNEARRVWIRALGLALMTAPFAAGAGGGLLIGAYLWHWLTP